MQVIKQNLANQVFGVIQVGGTQRLTQAMGKARAMDLCLTGAMFGADEALSSGLAARVFAGDELMDKTINKHLKSLHLVQLLQNV